MLEPTATTRKSARVTVVIATHNRRASLLHTLDRIDELPERPCVVVIDNDSKDGTAFAVRRGHPDVLVLEPGHNLGGAARTLGVLKAETPYVAFADDDSWWESGALDRAADLLDRTPRLAVVAARVLVEPGGRLDPTCAGMAASPLGRRPGLPGPAVLGFVACGGVLRRDAFLRVGGFHPRLGVGGEEQLLSLDLSRAGWELAYVADVVAHHAPSPARDTVQRRRVDRRNRIWVAWPRRPLPRAFGELAREAARAPRDASSRSAVVDAISGLPWVAAARRPLPEHVERAARLVHRAR